MHNTQGSQKRTPGPLGLELQMVVSCYRRQLEEASALINGAISLSCRLLIKYSRHYTTKYNKVKDKVY